jgi:hypothetical protein
VAERKSARRRTDVIQLVLYQYVTEYTARPPIAKTVAKSAIPLCAWQVPRAIPDNRHRRRSPARTAVPAHQALDCLWLRRSALDHHRRRQIRDRGRDLVAAIAFDVHIVWHGRDIGPPRRSVNASRAPVHPADRRSCRSG